LITQELRVEGVAVLATTPGSPAEAAGLRGVERRGDGSIAPGDVIVAVDGTKVDSVPRLLGRLDEHRVGDVVRLTVLRDGQQRDVRVKLQSGAD
jgi:S1-C subfamily serine protease